MASIKMGDKLFVVTRRDISPGYQGVQSQHAAIQFVFDHPERGAEWFNNSNYLAWLFIVQLGNPDFKFRVIEDDSPNINIGGYGLLGN